MPAPGSPSACRVRTHRPKQRGRRSHRASDCPSGSSARAAGRSRAWRSVGSRASRLMKNGSDKCCSAAWPSGRTTPMAPVRPSLRFLAALLIWNPCPAPAPGCEPALTWQWWGYRPAHATPSPQSPRQPARVHGASIRVRSKLCPAVATCRGRWVLPDSCLTGQWRSAAIVARSAGLTAGASPLQRRPHGGSTSYEYDRVPTERSTTRAWPPKERSAPTLGVKHQFGSAIFTCRARSLGSCMPALELPRRCLRVCTIHEMDRQRLA